MRIKSNLHCHSAYSDGVDSLEAMVLSAIGKGFHSLGFSEHAYTPWSTDCCIPENRVPCYRKEVASLKEAYRGQIQLYTGFEVESIHPISKEGLDFTIGSVHYVEGPGKNAFYCIDDTPALFESALKNAAGGDIRRLVRLYYDSLVHFAESYRPDIIGHIDLITKLNRDNRFFDETASWYRDIASNAAKKLLKTGCVIEVNTGGICSGYRQEPYPSKHLLEVLADLGAPLTLSADAHSADTLDFWFREAEALLIGAGVRTVKEYQNGAFVDVEL